MQWAMKNFTDWFTFYNKRNDNKCPKEVWYSPVWSNVSINQSKYVAETRPCSEEPYPPKINSLLSGILRHRRSANPSCPNFLDKNSLTFSTFMNTLDNLYKGLVHQGLELLRSRQNSKCFEAPPTKTCPFYYGISTVKLCCKQLWTHTEVFPPYVASFFCH